MPDLGELIGHWGYLAILLIVLPGNVGVPVPEETILILAGYLVWRGELRLLIVLALGIVSAVIGDNAGYWIGRRYGQQAVERYARWVLVNPERQESVWRYVTTYGSFAVFAARFFPGLRFLAGPLAGAAGLAFLPFLVANVLGAALFVPYAVGLGYAIGYGLGDYVERIRRAEYIVLLGAVIFAMALLGWLALRAVRARQSS